MTTDATPDIGPERWTVHAEVRLQPRTTARFDTIRQHVYDWLHTYNRLNLASSVSGWEDIAELAESVEHISISECPSPSAWLPVDRMALQIHVYQPTESDSFEEYQNTSDGNEEDTTAASICELPNRSMEGLWDSLIYEGDIKLKLLDYIHATLVIGDAGVDLNLISWNRVVLLHGPPGTGKTSLCRALAQKLSIRLSHRYSHARLLEINSHSLFSKWFSESGKLVQRLFSNISELADEDDAFLVVLIDEVESLTAARASAMAGTEPSDGLRVVNALLTQLDKLKHRKNVLIMSTSNLAKAIDNAFVDRADIIQYIDLPSRDGIYQILRSCLVEMISKGLVGSLHVPTLHEAQMYELTSSNSTQSAPAEADTGQRVGLKLLSLAAQCKLQQLSGRAIRRLPVLALAKYMGVGYLRLPNLQAGNDPRTGAAEIIQWLDAMGKVISETGTNLEKFV